MATTPSAGSPRILVVDDDPDVLDMVTDFLAQNGYAVTAARNAALARRRMLEQPAHLVIVDRAMPGEDGISLARYIREHYSTGIIMLTAARAVVDRVVGLEVGADDYICKPFDLTELLARVRSVLRRTSAFGSATGGAARVRFGRCVLDLGSHRLFDADGGELPITPMEFDLLSMFSQHPNRVLSRDAIMNAIQRRDAAPFDRSIDQHIARLRKKVEHDPGKPQVIKTVRGVGYMYVATPPG